LVSHAALDRSDEPKRVLDVVAAEPAECSGVEEIGGPTVFVKCRDVMGYAHVGEQVVCLD
jgi:hypothetical protein